MKKIVFVNLAIKQDKESILNNGIAFLVPILKKYGYEVDVLYIDKEVSNKDFQKRIEDLKPSIVGFSCTSHQLKYLIKYSKALEIFPNILKIAGGTHSRIDPERTLSKASLDGVCIGEGEIPLESLLKNIKNKKSTLDTEGFYWNVNGKIKKNPIKHFVADLSTLDFPDYSVFDKLIESPYGILIVLSRGCPYSCTYCCNDALSKSFPSKRAYFRVPSVKYAIDLTKHVIKQYSQYFQVNSIWFVDDNLIANEEWFINFAKKYKKQINLPYMLLGRVESINPKIIKALKKSGCRTIMFGVESGDEKLRYSLLNRRHSNKLILEKTKMIKKAGIPFQIFAMVGLPFETKKQMKETLKLIKKISPNRGGCDFFYPYKKTKLYEICKKNNLLKSEEELMDIPDHCTKPAIKMTKKQEGDCIRFKKKIDSYCLKKEYGSTTYYFLKPLWRVSAFLKTKSRLYENFINLLKKK